MAGKRKGAETEARAAAKSLDIPVTPAPVLTPVPTPSSDNPIDASSIAQEAPPSMVQEEASRMAVDLASPNWQPWHDEAVRLVLQGKTYPDTASVLGRTAIEVRRLASSDWFALRLAEARLDLRAAFLEGMRALWELNQKVVAIQTTVLDTFLTRINEARENEALDLPSLTALLSNRSLWQMMETIQDRIGLRVPEKHQHEIFQVVNQNTTVTVENFERKLQLVRACQADGVKLEPGAAVIDLEAGPGDG